MRKIIELINASAYADYTNNVATSIDVQEYKEAIYATYGFYPDPEYLNFLMNLNGFELNGVNFYGTKEQTDIYVKSAMQKNHFWKAEFHKFEQIFLIADGDIDFYCYDQVLCNYVTFAKASLRKMETYPSFIAFLEAIVKTYT